MRRAKKNLPAAAFPRRVSRAAAFVAFAAFPLLAAAASAEETVPAEENFPTRRTEFFSLSAESPEAAARAAELAREVEDFFAKTRRHWKNRLPDAGTRVGTELFKAPGIFRITTDEDARVTVFLSENFSDEGEMRSRLAEALLARMFFPNAGAGTARAVPPWIVSAAETECGLGGGFGKRIFLRGKSLRAAPVPLTELISAPREKFAEDENFRLNAVWLLRALDDVSVFFDAEKTPEEKLAAAFPKIFKGGKFDAGTADRFWAVRFRELARGASSGVDLPEESRRAFDDALLFLVEKNGEETRVLAGDLVRFRIQPEIRRCVADRLAEFAARFRKVNPVWHNAFTEYGVFLEMFGNPDVSGETLAAQWDKAVFARSDALAIQREIRAMLDASAAAEKPAGTPPPAPRRDDAPD